MGKSRIDNPETLVLKVNFGAKKKGSNKTGNLLKEVQFMWGFL
jgi:hypothetical protein